jgi:hypothetical protein
MHLIATLKYVGVPKVGWHTSYELIGLACLIVCDGLASLLGLNHLDFEVQSIHWLTWLCLSLAQLICSLVIQADDLALGSIFEGTGNQHRNLHRLAVYLVN